MIEESGRVVAVEDDAVWVETLRKAGCGRCDEPGGCGNGALARHARDRIGRVRARNDARLAVAVGDIVLVGVPPDAVLRGAFLIYVLPLALLLAGTLAGAALFPGDAGAVGGALAGLGGAFVALRLLTSRTASSQPVLLRRLPAPVDVACTRN